MVFKSFVLTGLATAIVLLASAPLPSQAQDEAVESINDDCVDQRDRSRSTRRRSGGANRDCSYQEVVIDAEGDAEIVKPSVAVQERPLMPRKFSGVPRPNTADYDDPILVPDRWRIVNALGYPDNWIDPYNQNTIRRRHP